MKIINSSANRSLPAKEPAIFVKRTDLLWGQPPWQFKQQAYLPHLHPSSPVPSLLLSNPDSIATAIFKLDKGQSRGINGYFVKGSVQVEHVVVNCEWCGKEMSVGSITETFNAWLNCDASGDDSLQSANEIAFPGEICDLSPLIVDALLENQPTVVKCQNSEECILPDKLVAGAGSGDKKEKGSQSSAFGKLESLKSKLKK